MALSSGTHWSMDASATAGNVNGGGFNTGNANFITDFTTDTNTANTSAPVISSVTYSFVAGDVGAWAYVVSGTNSYLKTFYQIASVSGGKATLSAAIGAGVQYNASMNRWRPSTNLGIASVGTPTGLTIGFDFSQQTTAEITATDYTAVGASATLTSVTGGFRTIMAGNIFHQTTTGTGAFGVVGWYEIISVTNGTTLVLDRTPNSGTASVNTTGFIGGSISMGSATLDDAVLEAVVAGNWVWWKFGTFVLGGNVSITTGIGTATNIIHYEGFNAVRGDAPTGTSRPTITGVAATATTTFGGFTRHENYIGITNTGAGFSYTNTSQIYNCKFTNVSTTATRVAFTAGGTNDMVEAVSYRGPAMQTPNGSLVQNCYFHDSDIGISFSTTSTPRPTVLNCVIANNVRGAIEFTGAALSGAKILNNTLFGSINTTGTGVILPTAAAEVQIENNIITGFATGVSHVDTQTLGYDNYNNYYNNDNDVSATTQWQKGINDTALDPTFTNVTQVTGTGATSSTNVLTDATKNFTTLGFVAGVDYVYLVSGTGTGFAANIYGITAVGTTTMTLSSNITSSGAGTNIIYQATLGNDYRIGTNLKALANRTFGTSSTVSYVDIGAVQRIEPTSSGFFIQ